MRSGITTGTCCTLCAYAAVYEILYGISLKEANIVTPKGVKVTYPVFKLDENAHNSDNIAYGIYKDSGDDPDVTNAALVVSRVYYGINAAQRASEYAFVCPDNPRIRLDGGIGIGRVTKAGLEQNIGQAAINKVPRQMIFEAVYGLVKDAGVDLDLFIEVEIPNGAELSRQTFNSGLGIEGGLSILGTSGILEPMSTKALIDTIEIQLKQKKELGDTRVVIAPGNYGLSYLEEFYGISPDTAVKCSNYIGDTLDLVAKYQFESFVLVGNIGKLCKLAFGGMNTHSKSVDGRREVFALHYLLTGGNRTVADRILESVNTDAMIDILIEADAWEPVRDSMLKSIEYYIDKRIGNRLKYTVVLFSEKHGYLGEVKT